MKVKGAFYAPALPGKIVVMTADHRYWMTPQAPFRILRPQELSPLEGWNRLCVTPEAMHWDVVPNYLLRLYGMEVVP